MSAMRPEIRERRSLLKALMSTMRPDIRERLFAEKVDIGHEARWRGALLKRLMYACRR